MRSPNAALLPQVVDILLTPTRDCLGLFLACKRVRDEALEPFLKRTTFIFMLRSKECDRNIFKKMPTYQHTLIRHLEIRPISIFDADPLKNDELQKLTARYPNSGRLVRDLKIQANCRAWSETHNSVLPLLPNLTHIKYDLTRIRRSCKHYLCYFCGNRTLHSTLEGEDPMIVDVPGFWLYKT